MPSIVHDSVSRHLALEMQIGGYEAEAKAKQDLDDFYNEFARLLNASPREIAYVENATRAWDMAFYGLKLQEGDRILTHASEYVSNYLALLQQAERRNLIIDLIPSDSHGQVDVDAIPALMTDRTRLIAITHVPTQGGLVNPVTAIGKIAGELGLMYMIDACQSVGQIELDVQALNCDVLTGSGRKFLRGPRGTGFMYVRTGFLDSIDPPFIDLHAANWIRDNHYELEQGAKRFENWESYVAGRIGLMTAVRYTNDLGIDNIQRRVTQLATDLRQQLTELPGISVHDLGLNKCGIVTFTKDSITPDAIAEQLREKRINISVSTLQSARLDFGERALPAVARSSVHYFNTNNEIDRFVEEVRALS